MLVYQRVFLSLWIRSVSIRPLPKESYTFQQNTSKFSRKNWRQGTNSWVCSCTKCLGLKIRSGSIYRVFQILMSCLINIINFLSDFQGTLPFVLGFICEIPSRIFWDLLKMSRESGIWQQWTCCPYRFPISCMALEPGQNEPMQISTTLRIIRKTYLFIYGSLNWPDVSLCFIICHYCSLFLCPIILYVH
jgi:hypothetical protein